MKAYEFILYEITIFQEANERKFSKFVEMNFQANMSLKNTDYYIIKTVELRLIKIQ